MQHRRTLGRGLGLLASLCGAIAGQVAPAWAGDTCAALGLGNAHALHAALTTALKSVAPQQAANGGLGNQMWATIVDQDGVVCAVTFTGTTRIDQWPGSRVISAQKANTATSFNLPAGIGGTVDALATAFAIFQIGLLTIAALRPCWAGIEADRPAAREEHAREAERLLDAYREHLGRYGLLVPPPFARERANQNAAAMDADRQNRRRHHIVVPRPPDAALQFDDGGEVVERGEIAVRHRSHINPLSASAAPAATG